MNLYDFVNKIKERKIATYNLNTGELNTESRYLVSVDGMKKNCPLSSVASSVATYIQENGFELSKPNRVIVGILMEDRLILDICADLELLCEAVKITDRQTVLYDGVGNIITMPNGDK